MSVAILPTASIAWTSASPSSVTGHLFVCHGASGTASPSALAKGADSRAAASAPAISTMAASVPPAPPSWAGSSVTAASRRSVARRTPRSQTAARRPTVVGTACCVSVRAAPDSLGMRPSERRKLDRDVTQVREDRATRAVRHEHQSRIKDVLARRAAMDPAPSGLGHPLLQLADERDDRVAARDGCLGQHDRIEPVPEASVSIGLPAERGRDVFDDCRRGDADRSVRTNERDLGGHECVQNRLVPDQGVVTDTHGREQPHIERGRRLARAGSIGGCIRRQGRRSPSRPAAGCRAAGSRRACVLPRA